MSDTRNHKCDSGNFDRTICPEPCGKMHSYCDICGERQDSCAHDEPTDTRNHTTRDQLADLLRDLGAIYQNGGTYTDAADALLASDAIAAVRAAAVAETTAAIEALPRLRRWIDDSELVDLSDVRAALSGGRAALDTTLAQAWDQGYWAVNANENPYRADTGADQ